MILYKSDCAIYRLLAEYKAYNNPISFYDIWQNAILEVASPIMLLH